MHAVEIAEVSHRYGKHVAVQALSLAIAEGEIFALLGPNGSGKSTLFRLISTLTRLQSGKIFVFGHSVAEQTSLVRAQLGVVFQAPSLDKQLTALENIRCQGALVGLRGGELSRRIDEVTGQLGLSDRLHARVATLSGGFKRRVEIAKGLLHKPRLLLMDEPSTGLDPSARLEMWNALVGLQRESGVTVVLTTHLLEEAEKADRIAIMDRGEMVAVGPPAELRGELGGQVLSIRVEQVEPVLDWLRERGFEAQRLDHQLQVRGDGAAELIAPLNQAFGRAITALTLGQPSLEDVFIAKTERKFEVAGGEY
jgi:ABC-2 type transport system ATP-binding protein